MPRVRLLALIAPHYPKAGPKSGCPPKPLEQRGLAEAIFADVNAHLVDKETSLRSDTLADPAIILAETTCPHVRYE